MEGLDKTFIRRKKKYNEIMGYENQNTGELLTVKLKFSSIHRVNIEDYFNDDEIEYLESGEMIVNIKASEDQDWIYNWILGYGNGVEVLEPEQVRRKLEEDLTSILNKYKK